MKKHVLIGMGAALALLASHGFAVAQRSNGPAPFYLNPQQKEIISGMLGNAREEPNPPNFGMRRGLRIPDRLQAAPIPRSVSRQVPKVQGYAYVKVPNHLMIVDPENGKVVERIDGIP